MSNNMKPTTLPGSTNSEGIFTPVNPYLKDGATLTNSPLAIVYNDKHPPLPCYTASNELVISREDVSVEGPVWQYKRKPDNTLSGHPDGWLTETNAAKVIMYVLPINETVGNNRIIRK